MTDPPTAPLGGAPREAEREILEDAWDVLNAAHLTLFEYAYERDEATFEKLRAQIAEGRRQVADVLGTRIEELESQLTAATARVQDVSAERDRAKQDAEWFAKSADSRAKQIDALRGQLETATARVREVEAERDDAFYGGYCCALSAGCPDDDGTGTHYVEAIDCIDEKKLLAWAEKNNDMEVPRIKAAIRAIRERGRDPGRAPAPPYVRRNPT